MKKLLLLLFAICALKNNAQIKAGGSYKDYFQEGSYLLLEDNYLVAQDNFEAAYQLDSTSANINYLLGQCYLHSLTQKSKAEYHLAKAVTNITKTYKNDNFQEKAAPPLAYYYYGQALHINYKFDEAIKEYEEFEKVISAKDKEWRKLTERGKATAIYAKEIVASPINIQITNLGDSINSQYPDFSPALSADERMMIYTTRRPNTTGGIKDAYGYFSEDIVISYKDEMGNWSAPQPISSKINTSGMEASINLTPDGQTLIVYHDKGDGMAGNIYYSIYDGKDWSSLQEFGSDVNSKYQESHACLNADQTVLFFVSDRPGGLGGKDIYRCIKLPNGKWSKALNMGPTINTEYDEDGAYIHPDGQTFFFASKGHKTMGGYDIMFASLNEENNFTDVNNIRYPINTTDDDIFYTSSPDGKRGYFSSAKDGGFGEKDIYMISIPEAKEKPLALFKGQIIPAEGEKLPEELTIIVKDKQTGEIIGTYRPKLVNGTFSTILPPGREYNFSYQAPAGQEFYNEDVFVTKDLSYTEIKREVNLEPVVLGKIKAKDKGIMLNTIVLDNSKSKKAIPGAKISVEEQGGTAQSFTANNSGRFDGIVLKTEKKYNVFADDNGKKSAIAEVSTIGAKSGKVINQILYMSGKASTGTKDLLLDVTVKNNKTKQVIPNAEVILTDADGNKLNAATDENGVAKNIELAPDTKYSITADSEGNVSENQSVSTIGVKGAKRFAKTLFVGSEKSVSTIAATNYEFYFKYNANINDDAEPTWVAFVDKVIELSKQKSVTITINSSASQVTTRAFKDNHELAATRASKLEERINAALSSKGGDASKVTYIKKSIVGGPSYEGDWDLGRAKYEPHQFVKAKVK